LLSFIGLSHGDDVPDAVALRVDHDHGAASKPSNADDSDFTIVSPSIWDLDRWAGEDTLGIEEIQAAVLQSPLTLGRIKADHRAGSAG
jgi:hypothetical protein